MIWIDIVFLVPLIWGAYTGFKKGLVAQVLGLVAIGLGIWLGTQHPHLVYFLLEGRISDKYIFIASFIIIFLAVVIAGLIISKLLEKMINFIQLKFINKIGGVVLGITKVFSFLIVIVFIIESWDTGNLIIKKSVKDSSIIYPILNESSHFILPKIENQAIIDLPLLKKEEN